MMQIRELVKKILGGKGSTLAKINAKVFFKSINLRERCYSFVMKLTKRKNVSHLLENRKLTFKFSSETLQ